MVSLDDAKKAAELEFKEEPMDDYYDHFLVGILSRMRVKRICKEIKNMQCEHILDVGCESGYATILFDRYAKHTHAIDIVEKAIKKFKKRVEGKSYNIDIKVGSAHKIEYDDNSMDALICTETIEHMPQLDKVFKEFRRVLKAGGKLIITFPNEKFRKFLYPIAKRFGINTDVEGEVTLFEYKPEEIINKIKKEFIVKKSFGFPFGYPVTYFVIAEKNS